MWSCPRFLIRFWFPSSAERVFCQSIFGLKNSSDLLRSSRKSNRPSSNQCDFWWQSRGEGLVRVPSGASGTRCTVSVIRRGLRLPWLPTRHLGGWTPPRRFGTPTRDVAPPPRGTPNPHLVSMPRVWSPVDAGGVVLSRPRRQGDSSSWSLESWWTSWNPGVLTILWLKYR